LDFVRQYPLRGIRSEEEYDHAIAVLNRLSDRGRHRTHDETEYVVALADFVEKYEEAHYPIPPASGAELLQYLIETHSLAQTEVAAGTSLAESTVSEILAGKRRLCMKHFEALARFSRSRPRSFWMSEGDGDHHDDRGDDAERLGCRHDEAFLPVRTRKISAEQSTKRIVLRKDHRLGQAGVLPAISPPARRTASRIRTAPLLYMGARTNPTESAAIETLPIGNSATNGERKIRPSAGAPRSSKFQCPAELTR
jgi:HTH-type transcriptional regulator / antitoxin HigA